MSCFALGWAVVVVVVVDEVVVSCAMAAEPRHKAPANRMSPVFFI
jgi:hypothetical protein